jgi:NTE family protein
MYYGRELLMCEVDHCVFANDGRACYISGGGRYIHYRSRLGTDFSMPLTEGVVNARSSPANVAEDPLGRPLVEDGFALCLSGGGYRAMLFHLGVVWRLYETGLLRSFKRISSVFGGSTTAAVLAVSWPKLSFERTRLQDDFVPLVVTPIRALAGRTLDRNAILGGIFLPGTIGEHVAAAYDEHLFRGATLQDLPDDADGAVPRFVLNATNVQSGALWRFSRPHMGDWRVGRIERPTLRLALAVAASSAFPAGSLAARDRPGADAGEA